MTKSMSYIWNFVLIVLSLQGYLAVASDTKRMPFPQSFPVSLSSSKGGLAPVNLKLLTPFFNNLSKFDFSKFNPYNIDLSGCKSVIADGITNTSDVVMNNPKKSLVAAALVAACMGSYYCISREVISKERVAAIKDFLIKHSQAFGTSCFNILPNEAQGAILLLTRPFQMLGGMIMNYATYHKKYVGLTALFALGGRAAGWDGTGYTFAGIAFAYGAFASRFDRLEEQNAETHKQISELQGKIIAFGSSADQKMDNVSGQVANVQITVEEIQGGIGELKSELQQLDKDNKEAAGRLQSRITDLEKSLKENLESRLQVLSGELKKEIAAVEVHNQEKADAIQKDLNGLTELVNKHQLSNIEEFKGVREFFTQSLSVLQVTLKEEMEQLRGEAASTKEEVLKQISSVSSELGELGKEVAQVMVQSEKIGTILDKTSSMATLIEFLQESAKKLEETSSQQNHNTITLTSQVEGLRDQLVTVERSFHERLQTLVSDMEELKRNQAEMKSEQIEMKSTLAQHGEGIQSISSIVSNTDKTVHEQNRLLFERLKKSEETLEQVLEGQQALKTQLEELARAGDKKVDQLQNTLLSAIGGSQEKGQKKDRKRLQSSRKDYNNQRGDEQQVLQLTFGSSTPSNGELISQMKQLNIQ